MDSMNATLTSVKEVVAVFTTDAVASVVILLLGIVAGKLVEKALRFLLHLIGVNAALKKHLGVRLYLEEIIPSIVAVIIYVITVVMALQALGIAVKVITLLFWFVLVVMVISLFLTLKDIIPNLVHGIALMRSTKISVGDRVRIANYDGMVKEINLTGIVLDQGKGEQVIIPHSYAKSQVIRHAKHTSSRTRR